MPACAAKGCYNSSRKKVKMNCFPADPVRRKEWVSQCVELGKMTDWTPKDYAALCSYHFIADMWEKPRIDGTIKLKHNAIPTIFGDLVYQVKNKGDQEPANNNEDNQTKIIITDPLTKEVQILYPSMRKRKIQLTPISTASILKKRQFQGESSTEALEELKCSQESEASITKCDEKKIERNYQAHSDGTASNKTLFLEEYSNDDISHQEKKSNIQEDPYSTLAEKYDKLEKLYNKSEKLRMTMKKRHQKIYRSLKCTIKKLQDKVRSTEVKKSNPIEDILNEDQLNVLNKVYKKLPQWCEKTLVKANQLKLACGIAGYNELLNQKIPLPSLRTLRRR